MLERVNRNRTLIFFYLLAGVLYYLLHLRYMAEYLDDAWTLSWAYGFWEKGTVQDYAFGYLNSRGSVLFHRTYSLIYGSVLSLFGWSRSGATVISTCFIWASSFFWYKSLKKAGYHKTIAHTVALLMLFLEIYVSLGNKLRVDALSFFIISLAFFLFVSGRYFWAGLLSVIAFENHPVSVTYYFWILAYLISVFSDMKARPGYYVKGAVWFIGGALIGVGYYLFLQYEYLDMFFQETTAVVKGHTLYAYFWKMKYAWRHLPEAFITLVAFIIFIRKKLGKKYPFVLPFFFLAVLSTFIIRRGNYHYTAFVYPSVILLIAVTAFELNKIRWTVILLALYLLPQYGFLMHLSRGFDQEVYNKKIETLVPDDGTMVVANSGAWFALKEREYREYGFFDRRSLLGDDLPGHFYLVSNDSYRKNTAGYYKDHERLFKEYKKVKLKSITAYDGTAIELYEYRRDK